MGQCISIQVGPQATAEQSANSLKNHGQRIKNHDDEMVEEEHFNKSEHAEMAICDENFGKTQSPINIFTAASSPQCSQAMASEDIRGNPLRFNYPDLVRGCTMINTGHTVQINIPDHSKCSLFINNKTYHLKQFHFHTPSEHMLNDVQFEMEMHLVHVNDDGEIAVLGFIFTTKTAYFKSTGALADTRNKLIAETKDIIMQSMKGLAVNKEEHPVHQDDEEMDAEETGAKDEGADNKLEEEVAAVEEVKSGALLNPNTRSRGASFVPGNEFLDQFWTDLPTKKTDEGEEIRIENAITFDYLFETCSKKFTRSVETNEIALDMEIFEYPGSLTTPPYTEGVHWMVNKQLHFINVKQLNKLSSCWGHHSNARECQEYHERKVEIRNESAMKGYFFN